DRESQRLVEIEHRDHVRPLRQLDHDEPDRALGQDQDHGRPVEKPGQAAPTGCIALEGHFESLSAGDGTESLSRIPSISRRRSTVAPTTSLKRCMPNAKRSRLAVAEKPILCRNVYGSLPTRF